MPQGSGLEGIADDSLPNSWERARTIALKAGRTPHLFSSCIRAISKVESIVDVETDLSAVREIAVRSSEYLLGISPTLMGVFYSVAQDLHSQKISQIQSWSKRELLNLFSLPEISAILSITFQYRRMKKRCEEGEWQAIRKKLLSQVELSILIGKKMQHIGVGGAIFIGAIRYLAIAAFAVHDIKIYQEIKRASRSPTTLFNMTAEEKIGGCNHLQIAAQLATELGYAGPRSPIGLCLGLGAIGAASEALSPKLREHVISWRAAMLYTERLQASGKLPDHSENEYSLTLSAEDLGLIESSAPEIIKSPKISWFDSTFQDLPAEVADQLRSDRSRDKAALSDPMDE